MVENNYTRNELKKWLKENTIRTDGVINNYSSKKSWWVNRHFNDELESLYKNTFFLEETTSLNERIKYILGNIFIQKKCYCGELINLSNIYCSSKCMKKCPKIKEKRKKTCLEKYGNSSFFGSESSKKNYIERDDEEIWCK